MPLHLERQRPYPDAHGKRHHEGHLLQKGHAAQLARSQGRSLFLCKGKKTHTGLQDRTSTGLSERLSSRECSESASESARNAKPLTELLPGRHATAAGQSRYLQVPVGHLKQSAATVGRNPRKRTVGVGTENSPARGRSGWPWATPSGPRDRRSAANLGRRAAARAPPQPACRRDRQRMARKDIGPTFVKV